MMNTKKLVPLFLSGALLVGAAGCSGSSSGNGGASAPSGSDAPVEAPASSDVKIGILIPGSPTDGGFSQQGAEAGKNLEKNYGYSVSTVEAATADVIKSEAETMAAEGYKIVFGHGGQCSSPFAEICEDYPDTWFVTFGGTEIRDNLFPVCMCAEEGTYVLGVAAGMMTQTDNIAYTLGGDYPAYTKTTMGFALGAKSVNPGLKIQEAVLSSPDSTECYETTMSQIKSGADMILSNSNEGQAGAMKAVTESDNVYTFGCLGDFFDMAPGKVLGNILGDYNVGYDNATKAIMDGTVKAEVMYLTIGNGCVSVEWNPDITLPDDVKAAVDQTYDDIKSGKIDVPNEYEQDQAKELLASYN
ncbi:BMP family protein [Pseudoflavonifractor sp. MSJ-37]|uniref:BMP family lipoprotein n=1 Tax=Pseudoflavonifractor sp. MSJ-37 TaxID=2841531 RepID=UPI001C101238|nr:BMP family protein [Pseudoflavonifractor sp. MSJ-37]MBU5434129.1 BMP family protein [Pseudoflavonifractor sp. MSJ-37]